MTAGLFRRWRWGWGMQSKTEGAMDEAIELTAVNNRCRAKLSMNSKGLCQIEATAEFDTPEEAAENLIDTLQKTRELAKNRGYRLVDEV